MYIIAVDAMGGDNAPRAIIDGCLLAAGKHEDVKILLFGPEDILKNMFEPHPRIEIRDAPDIITLHEAPVMALRKKPNSSMAAAIASVKKGAAQAVVSAGSTGAYLAGGMLLLGRIFGVERPALAPTLPGRKGPWVLIDCGANSEVRPEYYAQFGLMGSVYAQITLNINDPSVGLVNIGVEAEKGTDIVKKAHELMTEQQLYRFIGNVEGRDVPSGEVNVIVTDGFTGNIILKYTEGLAEAMFGMMKEYMLSDMRSKLGAALLKPALKKFKGSLDYTEYGGAPLLGVNGVMIKQHGSTDAKALSNAIAQARTMIMGDLINKIDTAIQAVTKKGGSST